MGTPFVVYSADSGELRSNPDGFAQSPDYVASIVWEKAVDDAVQPGDALAVIQWGDGRRENLCAPGDCCGHVLDLNRSILFEELAYEPSQYLAKIG